MTTSDISSTLPTAIPDTTDTVGTTGAAGPTADSVRAVLTDAARSREQQLAALPPFDGDLVAEAHRASVTRILTEIRTAIAKLDSSTYGTCTRCELPIPEARLELLPWTARCVRCAAL